MACDGLWSGMRGRLPTYRTAAYLGGQRLDTPSPWLARLTGPHEILKVAWLCI